MKKKLTVVLIIASSLFMFSIALHAVNSDKKSPEEVLDSAWEKFGLFSYGIGGTDPVISIGMDKTKSETKLREYLNENLPDDIREKYKVEVFKEDIKVLEKKHQKYLDELKNEN
ncbi:hypothetical protein [Bacillus atrophaeus]|uniref:hypothetical protein n=1 Tax=Bacillus atrophaeus TaxID=1452 RepID=UPI002281F2C5|nr:hypothetical protein [Bacillus atrophaeus]MCY8478023.1 hypothetical protein [Bacillus atrophaeus]